MVVFVVNYIVVAGKDIANTVVVVVVVVFVIAGSKWCGSNPVQCWWRVSLW